jgi:hypothetical protein
VKETVRGGDGRIALVFLVFVPAVAPLSAEVSVECLYTKPEYSPCEPMRSEL